MGLACCSDEVTQRVNALVTDTGLGLRVATRRDWFF